MPTIKDWAIDAAVDIIDHVKTGSTLEWVAERIHAHCPYKQDKTYVEISNALLDTGVHEYAIVRVKKDVAYMPVPRCETCGHYVPQRDGIGDCQLLQHGNYARDLAISRLAVADASGELAVFVVQKSFGCLQHKEKK